MDVSSASTLNSSTTASLLQAANDNTQVASRLLKIAVNADKNLINTLLPVQSGLNIKA